MAVKRFGPGPWCGSLGGYTNHRCRCDRCREANRAAAHRRASPETRAKNAERMRAARKRQKVARQATKKMLQGILA